MLPDATTADSVFIHDRTQEIPVLVLANLILRFPTSNLLVQRVEQLLTRRRASECSTLVQRAAKTSAIDVAFRCAIERDAQAIHQIDDLRRPVGHFLHGRLMVEKVTTVNRIVEVLPLVITLLTRVVVDGVDSTLCTNTM